MNLTEASVQSYTLGGITPITSTGNQLCTEGPGGHDSTKSQPWASHVSLWSRRPIVSQVALGKALPAIQDMSILLCLALDKPHLECWGGPSGRLWK